MFNKKLKCRIEELERDLRTARNDSNALYEQINSAHKRVEDVTKCIEEKERKIKQLTADLDILKSEREEIREKCESAVDKDALLKLYIMKNHDLEMQINDLRSRLLDELNLNSSMLLRQSILYNTHTAPIMQQCCYPHGYSIF